METQKWQPIATAPKDGTLILVCVDAHYLPKTACWATYHPNAAGKATWRDAPICGDKLAPTHWMPLLPKPSEQ
jgi:hypothetical protein